LIREAVRGGDLRPKKVTAHENLRLLR